MFFDAKVFIQFCKDCKTWGIDCPIVPGLMCIQNYAGFSKMTKFCKTRVPAELQTRMEAIKDDAAAMKQFGIDFGIALCQEILKSGFVQVLHFYTLNLEKCTYAILDGLGLTENATAATNESDASSMVAKGSAWARVGDKVKTQYGHGVVAELNGTTGAAKVAMESWLLAGDQQPIAYLQLGQYEKVF
jgi:methylenetetrahydrofolate reductase (NADPH)